MPTTKQTALPPTSAHTASGFLSRIKGMIALGAKKAEISPSSAKPTSLAKVLLPTARTRWSMPLAKQMTPAVIEGILRDALTGASPRREQELYTLMEQTWPRLAKNIQEIKNAVIGLEWNIVFPDDQPEDTAAADLARRARLGMRSDPASDGLGWEGTLRAPMDGWFRGVSLVEIDWAATGTAILPRQTHPIPPYYYGWHPETSRLMLYPAPLDPGSAIEIPREKFLIATRNTSGGHPAGGALLRPLAFWWCAANFSAEWFLNFAQIFGQPFRWATYDRADPDAAAALGSIMESMGSSAWGVGPEGTTIEFHEAAKGAGDNPQTALLDRADTACDILLLATAALAADGDMIYLQKDVTDSFVERILPLTPSTFLSISANGIIQVQSAAAFKSSLGLPGTYFSGNYSDLSGSPTTWAWGSINGKPTTLAGYGIGAALENITYLAGETSPSGYNVIPSVPWGMVTVTVPNVFMPGTSSAAVSLPSYPLTPGQKLKIKLGTLDPNVASIKIYGRNPDPGTWTDLYATLTKVGQSVTIVARDSVFWAVDPVDVHASSHATGSTDPLTPAQIGAATASQGALAATALQPSWSGSGNLTTIGTLAAGTVPVARIFGLGSLATQNGTISDYPTKSANETISGNWDFFGNVTMNLAESVTFQRVNIGSEDYGWRFNPAGGGQLEFVFPGGRAAFYETGAPKIPYMYFPGTVQADYLIGAISGVTINANGLSGSIPFDVVKDSLSSMSSWLSTEDTAGASGITWQADGDMVGGREPAAGDYFPVTSTVVVSGGTNYLAYGYKTQAQFSAYSHPSASASLDFPSIAAGASASLTITVSGVATTNTPTVALGWSAALPAGIVVSYARVSAANTVTVTLTNISGAAIDPAAVTCRASVTQY